MNYNFKKNIIDIINSYKFQFIAIFILILVILIVNKEDLGNNFIWNLSCSEAFMATGIFVLFGEMTYHIDKLENRDSLKSSFQIKSCLLILINLFIFIVASIFNYVNIMRLSIIFSGYILALYQYYKNHKDINILASNIIVSFSLVYYVLIGNCIPLYVVIGLGISYSFRMVHFDFITEKGKFFKKIFLILTLILNIYNIFEVSQPYVSVFVCFIFFSALTANQFRNFERLDYDFLNLKNLSLSLARKTGELSKAQIEAQRAQVAKEDFLATMSHEIRTPINGIVGFAQLLVQSGLDQDQRRFIEMINTSSNNLTKLVDDILDLPNLISGNVKLASENFKLYEVVEKVIDILTPKSYEKSIDLNYFIEPSVPKIYIGDAKRIGQVLLNLANNALKFTEQGEVFIGVTKLDLLENNVLLQFEVKDTGPGIPKDKLSSLFKSFSQTDASISRKYGGTGLGLAISKQLIELMGGKIWVESTLGVGTRFIFNVKLHLSEQNSDQELHTLNSNLKCLVVSESLTTRYILGRTMKQWKLPAKITGSLDDAQNYLGTEQFDCMVVDIGTDIKSMTLFLKGNKINPTGTLPTIALINLGKNTIKNLNELANVCIPKPLKTHVLMENLIKISRPQKISIDKERSVQLSNEPYLQSVVKRILVVEDNPVNLKLILAIVKKLGYKVEFAENGKIALDTIEKDQNFDLILMDLQMPVMDGLEATRNIKALPIQRCPVIVALTANAMEGDKEKCLGAGMDDYLSKPVQIQKLKETLEKWLK